jgi:hypothetical protein
MPASFSEQCLPWLGFLSTICVGETEQAARQRLDEFIAVGGPGPIVRSANEGSRE